jgi:hypothetical protein
MSIGIGRYRGRTNLLICYDDSSEDMDPSWYPITFFAIENEIDGKGLEFQLEWHAMGLNMRSVKSSALNTNTTPNRQPGIRDNDGLFAFRCANSGPFSAFVGNQDLSATILNAPPPRLSTPVDTHSHTHTHTHTYSYPYQYTKIFTIQEKKMSSPSVMNPLIAFTTNHLSKLDLTSPLIQNEDCPICLDPYSTSHLPVQVIKKGRCAHIFGQTCLNIYMENNPGPKRTCPMCRHFWYQASLPVLYSPQQSERRPWTPELERHQRRRRIAALEGWLPEMHEDLQALQQREDASNTLHARITREIRQIRVIERELRYLRRGDRFLAIGIELGIRGERLAIIGNTFPSIRRADIMLVPAPLVVEYARLLANCSRLGRERARLIAEEEEDDEDEGEDDEDEDEEYDDYEDEDEEGELVH